MSMPKNFYQHYISLSANVGFGFKHYVLNYLKGIKQAESELTSANVPHSLHTRQGCIEADAAQAQRIELDQITRPSFRKYPPRQ